MHLKVQLAIVGAVGGCGCEARRGEEVKSGCEDGVAGEGGAGFGLALAYTAGTLGISL